MKKMNFTRLTLFSMIGLSLIIIAACSKPASSTTSTTATGNGTVTFWTGTKSSKNDSIYVNKSGNFLKSNYIGTCTTNYNTAPACSASGCASFTGAPGTYNYEDMYYDQTNNFWVPSTGTITITANGCAKVYVN